MFTFRRALIAAAFILTVFYLISSSHSSPSVTTANTKTAQTVSTADKDLAGHDGAGTKTGVVSPPPSSSATSEKSAPKVAVQRPLKDMTKAPLIDQLEYQFPYDVDTKFPAYIWQTWKYTPQNYKFSDDFRAAEASWTDKHPGFIHEVITDKVAGHLFRHLYAAVPDVLEAYNALPLPILKADFFRYLILLARGGIYSDIDTMALKSNLEWIPESVPHNKIGLVIGIEADPDREDWKEWYSRRIQFCQWTIQAKPGHPVLREIVANITLNTLAMKKKGKLNSIKDHEKVVDFTGPAVWTDIIFDFFNNPKYFDMENSEKLIDYKEFTGMTSPKKVGDVVVLPITSFSPGVQQMGAGEDDDPMAFVKHAFIGMYPTGLCM
jgi:alpha 1,6-mannosyltransferase